MRYMVKQLLIVGILFGLCVCLSWAGAEGDFIFGMSYDGSYASIRGYDGTVPTTLTIPSEYKGVPVTAIRKNAFYQCKTLVNVSIPDTITTIENYAFRECTRLKSIDLSKTKAQLGEHVFKGCTSLKTAKLPETGMLTVSYGLFQDCRSLEEIIIPEGVSKIDNYAFACCESLTSVVIPDTVTEIRGCSFYDCCALETVTLPPKLKILTPSLFDACTELTTVNLPENLEQIQKGAFWDCSALKNIVLPEGLKTIDELAFAGCEALETIYLPSSLTAIGANAFYCCYSLKAVHIPEMITQINKETFLDCRSMTEVTLPTGLKTIAVSAFSGCKSLKSIDLPDSVNSIGAEAFYGCAAITKISIPRGVISLKSKVFGNCTALKQVFIPDSVQSVNNNAFSTKPIVYCYEGSAAATWAKSKGCKRVYITEDTLAKVQTLSIPDTMVVYLGTQGHIRITAYPQAEYGSLLIESSAPEIVSVEGDALVGNKYGEATVTVTLNGVSKSCLVKVDLDSWIELPSELNQVRYEAFAGANSQGVKIPDGVRLIGERAFANNESLILVLMPDSVTDIADNAFEGCDNVEFICASMNTAAAYAKEKGIPFSVE